MRDEYLEQIEWHRKASVQADLMDAVSTVEFVVEIMDRREVESRHHGGRPFTLREEQAIHNELNNLLVRLGRK